MRFVFRRNAVFCTALLLAMVFASSVAFAGHHGASEDRTGILLVAFGTSEQSARISFDLMDAAVKAEYPDTPVYWAFTSHIIRKKLAKRGQVTDSVPTALSRMLDDGITRIAVQSLHVIPGEEYHDKMLKTVLSFGRMKEGFKGVALGDPLLSVHEDMEAAAKAALAVAPKERKAGEALILMGHGTHHPANVYYPALQWYLSRIDPLAFVGTVEGAPLIEVVLEDLKKHKVRKAWLMPLMSVAGDHAKNDMAGAEEDSWKSVLEANGIEARPVLKGLAEYKPFRDMWVSHLRKAMDSLEKR